MESLDLIIGLEKFFSVWSYPVVFLSGLIEMSPFGWVIPGGLFVTIAAFFSYGDTFSFAVILFLGWIGSYSAFLLAYLLGNKTGNYFVKKLGQERNAKRAETLLKNHGGVILTTSMLAGLTRFWVAYMAGAQKYKFAKFSFYSLVASLTWTSLQAAIGYLAGAERQNLEQGITRLGILGWIFLLIAAASIIYSAKKEYQTFKEDKVPQ